MKICRHTSAHQFKLVATSKTYVVGLASDIDLLSGHLAKDSDGNAGWEMSVLTNSDVKERGCRTARERVLLKPVSR